MLSNNDKFFSSRICKGDRLTLYEYKCIQNIKISMHLMKFNLERLEKNYNYDLSTQFIEICNNYLSTVQNEFTEKYKGCKIKIGFSVYKIESYYISLNSTMCNATKFVNNCVLNYNLGCNRIAHGELL